MMRIPCWLNAFICCSVLAGMGVGFAQDWPQWRGPNRDGKATGFTPPMDWTTGLTLRWSTPVGVADAGPALVGDRLYVRARQGDDELTLCLDVADGRVIWRDAAPAGPVSGAASGHPGPRATPAVAEGKVVALGVNGVLSCFDAVTGAVVWRQDPFPGVVPQFYTASSPLIVDGKAIAHLGGAGNGALMAFDLATGEEEWRWAGEGPDYASPVLLLVEDTTQVVTLTEKSLVGVNAADGQLLWQVPFATGRRSYNTVTPVIDGQTVIYTGAGRGTHAVKVDRQGEGFVATPLWSNPDVGCGYCTPVLRDGFLYGMTERGNLFCLNAHTGQVAWLEASQVGQRGFGAIVDAGSALLALPNDGQLIVYQPSSAAFTELARLKVADTATFSCPAVGAPGIFIQDQEAVRLWAVP